MSSNIYFYNNNKVFILSSEGGELTTSHVAASMLSSLINLYGNNRKLLFSTVKCCATSKIKIKPAVRLYVVHDAWQHAWFVPPPFLFGCGPFSIYSWLSKVSVGSVRVLLYFEQIVRASLISFSVKQILRKMAMKNLANCAKMLERAQQTRQFGATSGKTLNGEYALSFMLV